MPESLQKKSEFDEIRPYYDEEVNDTIQNLIPDPAFQKFIQYFFPKWDKNKVTKLLEDVSTIKEFQQKLMYPAAQTVVDKTTKGITHSGFDKLDQQQGYLFISNHRDIVLDSAFLNLILFQQEMDTCEVAIGSNLLIQPWIKDLVRLNKNFIVHRDVPSKKLYEYSLRLSNYIRQAISKSSSVWIAQREGRTKDGNDLTQAGLLKMLSISGGATLIDNFKALHMIPLAISYEYEPCDYLKARELYIRAKTGHYKKSSQDDLKSMFQGLAAYKGRVHFALGNPIADTIDVLNQTGNKNDLIKALVDLINQEIHDQYYLWPSNYIAHDLLYDRSFYHAQYTQKEKEDFLAHMENALQRLEEPAEELRPILLKIYATPVENKMQK